MSIFVKAGLWLEKKAGFKGEFNLTKYVTDLIASSPSGSATLQQVTDQGDETTNNIALLDTAKLVFDNGSRLQKGTTNSQTGGNGGIAQVCSIDYELKWEAGRQYVMQQDGFTIREVSYNFTLTPGVNDDSTRGFVSGSRWILDNGDIYVCTDNTTENAVWELQLSTALVFLDEGGGNGIVRSDSFRDPENFGDIGLDAFDISWSNTTGNYGATGGSSFAVGDLLKAQGYGSFLIGASNTSGVDSNYTFQSGIYHIETGLGYSNFFTGAGHSVTGGAYATIVGQFANVVTNNINNVNDGNNTMFAVGNGRATGEGTLLERSTALQVYRDGRIVAPSLTTALINADTTGKMVATKEYVDSIRPYKVYTALLSQVGTSAPTVIVLENTLGVTVTFTYLLVGQYRLDAIGALTLNKTFVIFNSVNSSTQTVAATPKDVNGFNIVTRDSANVTGNNILNLTEIEIRVYN